MVVLLLASCDTAPGPSPGPACRSDLALPMARIDDVMALIADLPTPLDLPCFVSALARPLAVEAASDVFSAQPAVDATSPRMFLRSLDLTLTIVPEGEGAHLLELGEFMPDGRSIKGEIVFPVEDALDDSAAYDRVAFDDGTGTSCGVCHGDEVDVRSGVFASTPFRPHEDKVVPLDLVKAEADSCSRAQTVSERCDLLRAVFAGPVVHAPFPADLPTIYDPR